MAYILPISFCIGFIHKEHRFSLTYIKFPIKNMIILLVMWSWLNIFRTFYFKQEFHKVFLTDFLKLNEEECFVL